MKVLLHWHPKGKKESNKHLNRIQQQLSCNSSTEGVFTVSMSSCRICDVDDEGVWLRASIPESERPGLDCCLHLLVCTMEPLISISLRFLIFKVGIIIVFSVEIIMHRLVG